MWKQLFLLEVLMFYVLALVSAQSAKNVIAYESKKFQNKVELKKWGVLCAAEDGNKSLWWLNKYGWASFCGPVGPLGIASCGKCLNVCIYLENYTFYSSYYTLTSTNIIKERFYPHINIKSLYIHSQYH